MTNRTRRSNGEGHVQRDGDAWRGYRTIQGQRLYRRGRTRQEVVNKLKVLDIEALNPEKVLARPERVIEQVTVASWLYGWHHRHSTWLKTSTARRYADLIRLHIVPIIGDLALSEVKYSTIDGLLTGMINQKYSRSTMAQVRTILSQGFDAALRDGIVVANPAQGVRIPKALPPLIQLISPSDREAIIRAAAERGIGELGRRRIALYLGLRQSEVLGLAWSDLDLDNGLMHVQASLATARGGPIRDTPKSAKAVRTINLNEEMIKVLREVKEEQILLRCAYETGGGDPDEFNTEQLVFVTRTGRPINARNDLRGWAITLRKANVAYVRIHDARHSVATELAAAGIDTVALSRFMGHASAAFTLATYVHRSSTDVIDAEASIQSRKTSGATQFTRDSPS